MTNMLRRLWVEDDAVLSFEWVMLLTLLTIGIVSGLTAARDAIIDELGDIAQAALAFDQSYSLSDFDVVVGTTTIFTNNPSVFTDSSTYRDCTRSNLGSPDQGPVQDLDS